MQTVVVVNGAVDWQRWLPGLRVEQVWLGRSRWVLERGAIWIVDRRGAHRPDVVLWRVGAVTPQPEHRACLELIRLAGVPCVNPAEILLRGYDRLSMLYELRAAGLPVVPCTVAVGDEALALVQPELPAVLKVGNLHGGLGKARAMDAAQWSELTALAHSPAGYATAEPFLAYRRDVRCLAVGDEMWAMERASDTWRANVNTTHHALITPPPELRRWTRAAMNHLGADILGVDFLEVQDAPASPDREEEPARWVALESNDIPGVRGFPDAVYHALARRVRARLAG